MFARMHSRFIERLESAIEVVYYVAMIPAIAILYMVITGTLPMVAPC